MPINNTLLDEHLKRVHGGNSRSGETSTSVTLGGNMSAQRLRELIDAAKTQGWKVSMVSGALTLSQGP